MQFKLVVVAGAAKTQEIKLRLPAVLGRGRACSVQLPHPLVSRQHCELFEAENKLFVRDLGSLNGTLVDGRKVSETEVRVGQQLTIGSLTFRVELGEAVSESPPPRRQPPAPTPTPVPTPGAASRPSAPLAVVPAPAAGTKTVGVVLPTVDAPVASPVPPPQATPSAPLAAAATNPSVDEPASSPVSDTDEPLADFAEVETRDSPLASTSPPTIAPAAEAEPVALEFADSFPAEESGGEDGVEVVEDAADLLPPAVSPPPPGPFVPDGSEPTTVQPTAPAVAPTSPSAPSAPPAERSATQTAAAEDEDLAVFLRSLGK